MSTNTALDDIGARIRACKPCNFGLRHANKLAHEDAPKMLAALEAVQGVIDNCAPARWVSPSAITRAIEEALR